MPGNQGEHRPHFVFTNNAETESFKTPSTGRSKSTIEVRNRHTHGQALMQQVHNLQPLFAEARTEQQDIGINEGYGLQVEFQSFPGIELAFESLARETSGIELRNVRKTQDCINATVFIPDGKLNHFEKLITTYLDDSKDTQAGPRNQKLLNAIESIRSATLEALWTDDIDLFPVDENEQVWWEVWLPVGKNRRSAIEQFQLVAISLGFRLAEGEIEFPERTVMMVNGSASQLKRSIMALSMIAELRQAKETADFFDSLAPQEQHQWAAELQERLSVLDPEESQPHICILDTGINNGHPLLANSLQLADCHTINPSWGHEDQCGHGTEMAGLALFGNLTPVLVSNTPVTVSHRLESVKLLGQNGTNGSNPKHHGYLTAEATSRPEISAPRRKRIFSMAITAKDNRDRGRPSAWSSTIDRLASDAENQNESPRLFVLSAGNIVDPNAWEDYPDSNSTDGIHDPAQSWNALTIGAYTELVTVENASGYHPIAPLGGLSPFSTTSQTWQNSWPLKPDIVFEGGNAAKDTFSASTLPSLSLLTTHYLPNNRLLTTTNATSAATALGARMAAKLMAQYPELRLETIRALMVHSAKWTDTMKAQFLSQGSMPTKTQLAQLIRHCGFGVPNISSALWSVENSLTLISEDQLHPFQKVGSSQPKLRDMNLHALPWPLNELESLGHTEVEMRVTLSYFIEPNPSARGVITKYRYQSHGLRFEVKRPYESNDEFRARINAAARNEEEYTKSTSTDSDWLIGSQNRHKGSIHSDTWRGSAVDLASRGVIAIYPTLGWWKTRPALQRYNFPVKYSLLVSIIAPETNVDLYTAISNQTAVPIEIA